MSEFYWSTQSYEETMHERIAAEHGRTIVAAIGGNTDGLVRATADHRAAAERLPTQGQGGTARPGRVTNEESDG